MSDIKRYGIDTLCGGCGQRGGGWTPVEMENGPFVRTGDAEAAIAEAVRVERERWYRCMVPLRVALGHIKRQLSGLLMLDKHQKGCRCEPCSAVSMVDEALASAKSHLIDLGEAVPQPKAKMKEKP